MLAAFESLLPSYPVAVDDSPSSRLSPTPTQGSNLLYGPPRYISSKRALVVSTSCDGHSFAFDTVSRTRCTRIVLRGIDNPSVWVYASKHPSSWAYSAVCYMTEAHNVDVHSSSSTYATGDPHCTVETFRTSLPSEVPTASILSGM